MAASRLLAGSGGSVFARPRAALSLIELLVVLFIISVLMALLLPALGGARDRMQATVCQNNVRQLDMGLWGYIHTTKKFPIPNRWTVDMLKWTEEWALADAMKDNFDPNAHFDRPPLLRCPMQEDFPSRVPDVAFSHYVLTVDRPERPLSRNQMEKLNWEIHDRQLLSDSEPQEPWYLAPELTHADRDELFDTKPGPHPPGLYMTEGGLVPQ